MLNQMPCSNQFSFAIFDYLIKWNGIKWPYSNRNRRITGDKGQLALAKVKAVTLSDK
jgi:hypothetical protein